MRNLFNSGRSLLSSVVLSCLVVLLVAGMVGSVGAVAQTAPPTPTVALNLLPGGHGVRMTLDGRGYFKSFNIYRADGCQNPSAAHFNQLTSLPIMGLSYADNNLKPGAYCYRVGGWGGNGGSETLSNAVYINIPKTSGTLRPLTE